MRLSTVAYDNKYLPQILKLWGEQYDNNYVEKRKKLFEWMRQENPFINGAQPYYLLVDGERVIGMHGMMPMLFSINGKQQRGYFAHDVLLSKEYRGQGLGKVILGQMIDKTDSFAGALWFNEPNYRLYKKSEWLDIPHLSSYVKIKDPEYLLRKVVKNGVLRSVVSKLLKMTIAAKDKMSSIRGSKNVKILEVKKFDARLDEFFFSIVHHYGIIAVRNHAYLNWKFVQKPYNNYKKFIALNEFGNIAGYIVMKTEKIETGERCRILDFLANPAKPEVLRAMLVYCCEEMSKKGVAYIQMTTSMSAVADVAKKCGFIKARKPVYFMIKNWESAFEMDFVTNKNNWYVTESDADGDSWSVDC